MLTSTSGYTLQAVGIDDEQDHRDMLASLSDLNFNDEEQRWMFALASGILHLGNITFVSDGDQVGSRVPHTHRRKHFNFNSSRMATRSHMPRVSSLSPTTLVKANDDQLGLQPTTTLDVLRACSASPTD